MGRLSTLIGLLAMSIAVFAIAWPSVEKETLPYLWDVLRWFVALYDMALLWLARLSF